MGVAYGGPADGRTGGWRKSSHSHACLVSLKVNNCTVCIS